MDHTADLHVPLRMELSFVQVVNGGGGKSLWTKGAAIHISSLAPYALPLPPLGNMKVPESILAPASTALSVGAFAAVMGLIKELSVLEKEVQPYTKETSEAGPAPPGQC